MTAAQDVGSYLERHASLGKPLYYGKLVAAFPDLPPLKGNWKAHPLCDIFGELDEQDHAAGRPMRTALVVTKELPSEPGPGFFEAIDRLRGTITNPSERTAIWLSEFGRLIAYYQAA